MIQTPLALAHSAIALSSVKVYTAPVGLLGEHRIRPFTFLLYARSRSLTLTLRPHSTSPCTSTGSARDRCTICGYDTHAGAGMSTRWPGPNSVKQMLNRHCLEPELTTMWSAFTGRPPDSIDRWRAIAERSSMMPILGG